ncbi:MAG TPA: chemotaxis protein CheW [Labilithrix sp.]|nr:chemotaxis protein CheW [Labilithrix sp.]
MVERRTSIDWSEIREALERSRRAVERLLEPDAETGRRIMDERARSLARPVTLGDGSAEDSLELACFSAHGEELAIETRFVVRVADLPPIEPVPWASPHFLGVVNYQGTVLPVVALHRLLATAEGETAPAQMLVLGTGQPELALAIDAAEGVVRATAGTIDVATALLREDPLLQGIHGARRAILRGAALLSDPRLFSAGENHETDDR